MTFQIQDWTGKVKYHGRTFPSFQEGREFLTQDQRQRNPNVSDDELEEILGEFYVEPVKPEPEPIAGDVMIELLALSGESTVMYELLIEDETLVAMVRKGETHAACLAYINENW